MERKILEHRTDDLPFTYRKLKDYLATLTETQLDQRVQLLPPENVPEPIRLLPVIDINTIEYYCHTLGEMVVETRSTVDFAHHPEQIVLLSDRSPYDRDGNSFFTLEKDENDKMVMRGNKTGKLYSFGKI